MCDVPLLSRDLMFHQGKIFGQPLSSKALVALSVSLATAVVAMQWSSANDSDHMLIAKSNNSRKPKGPVKQIFEASQNIGHSQLLGADGVAAYVVSAMGTNRGFLVKDLSSGLANNIGVSVGDVVMSFDGRVVQSATDVDRVLAQIPTGSVKVIFAHPSDAGLQLYNGSFRYENRAGANFVPQASGSVAADSGSKIDSHAIMPMPAIESYIVDVVNQDRRSNGGLGPLRANGALAALARAHATDMIKRGFFAHVNPDGKDPQQRAREAGLSVGVYENIAYQSSSDSPSRKAKMCEEGFMAEPPNQQNHRGNILMPGHTSIGVGVVMRGNKLMLVQEFSDRDP